DLRMLLERVVARAVPSQDAPRVVVDAPIHITIPIDALRIERVVANLLGNALKYAPKCTPIVVQLEPGALAARISVTDVGTSLAPEDTKVILEKHRRGTNAHGCEGRGLGL